MAYTKEQKEKFIELRAQGLSFEKISHELGISKPTLIKWNQELEKEIGNLEFLQIQAVIEKFKISKREKIKLFSEKLEQVYAEIAARDLSDVTLKDLIVLKTELEAGFLKEIDKVVYHTGEYTNLMDNIFKSEKPEKLISL